MNADEIREELIERGLRWQDARQEYHDERDRLASTMRYAREARISVTEAAELAGISRVTAHTMLKGE